MREELCAEISVQTPWLFARYQTWAVYSLDRRVPLSAWENKPLFMRRLSCR